MNKLSNMDCARIQEILQQHLPQLLLVYIFGSVARGDANEESDLDLAVLSSGAFDILKKIELVTALSEALKRDVDVLDLTAASDVMKVQVIKDGVLIFAESELAKAEFEMYALSDYARLNEERAGILKDFYGEE